MVEDETIELLKLYKFYVEHFRKTTSRDHIKLLDFIWCEILKKLRE